MSFAPFNPWLERPVDRMAREIFTPGPPVFTPDGPTEDATEEDDAGE